MISISDNYNIIRYFISVCGKLQDLSLKLINIDHKEEFETVRSDLQYLIQQYKSIYVHKYSQELYKQMLYLMIALMDEVIINSTWIERQQWINNTLEHQYFGTNYAGTSIINDIDTTIKNRDTSCTELIYGYLILLGYGFHGSARNSMENQDRYNSLISLLGIKIDANHLFPVASYDNFAIANTTKKEKNFSTLFLLPIIFLVSYLFIWICAIIRTNYLL